MFRELVPSVPQEVDFFVLELKIDIFTQNSSVSKLLVFRKDFFTVLSVPQDNFPVSSVPRP